MSPTSNVWPAHCTCRTLSLDARPKSVILAALLPRIGQANSTDYCDNRTGKLLGYLGFVGTWMVEGLGAVSILGEIHL